jgi:hypothetical protein
VLPAGLGGHLVDTRILCAGHNASFGATTDAALVSELQPLNAAIGVKNERRGEITSPVRDTGSGRGYLMHAGGRLRLGEPLVLSDEGPSGAITFIAPDQQSADAFVFTLKRERTGKTLRRRSGRLLVVGEVLLDVGLGSPNFMRGIARLVLNVLAHRDPDVARAGWLAPLRSYVANGGDESEWLRHVTSAPASAPAAFAFSHRFWISLDAQRGAAHAHVSMLGVLEVELTLGSPPQSTSRTIFAEVDVLAGRDEGGWRWIESPHATAPGDVDAHWQEHVDRRVRHLLGPRRDRLLWDRDAPALLAALQDARGLVGMDLRDAVGRLLRGQRQRALNLARRAADRLVDEAVRGDLDVPARSAFVHLLGGIAEAAPHRSSGVSRHTDLLAGMVLEALGDALSDLLEIRSPPANELHALLEGSAGEGIATAVLLEAVLPVLESLPAEPC